MRFFAVSDIHLDYQENRDWLSNLSSLDYLEDCLILAGDVTDELTLLEQCFHELSTKFYKVLFVPGNHELWVTRDKGINSIEKYQRICDISKQYGIVTQIFHHGSVSIVPLLSWYDFSFALPESQLMNAWMDFRACRWPDHYEPHHVTKYFLTKNTHYLQTKNDVLISFSHFLPRIDLMPSYISPSYHYLYPVLGSQLLEKQIRILKPNIHVYGHSHVNREVTLEGIQYLNNAFGYPSEDAIASKRLRCIHES